MKFDWFSYMVRFLLYLFYLASNSTTWKQFIHTCCHLFIVCLRSVYRTAQILNVHCCLCSMLLLRCLAGWRIIEIWLLELRSQISFVPFLSGIKFYSIERIYRLYRYYIYLYLCISISWVSTGFQTLGRELICLGQDVVEAYTTIYTLIICWGREVFYWGGEVFYWGGEVFYWGGAPLRPCWRDPCCIYIFLYIYFYIYLLYITYLYRYLYI